MPDFDTAYHRLFSQPEIVEQLLRDLIRPPWLDALDLSTLKRMNLKLHGEGTKKRGPLRREGDVLWQVQLKGGGAVYLCLILEFQRGVERFMPVRHMVYIGLLYQHLIQEKLLVGGMLPPVFPIVLYNGKRPWTAPTSLEGLILKTGVGSLDDAQPRVRYTLLEEKRFPKHLLKGSGSVLSTLVELEQCEDPAEALVLLARLVDLLAGEQRREIRRAVADFLNASRIGPHMGNEGGDFHRILEGGHMWLEEKFKRWGEEYRQEGVQVGRQEGRQEGRQQGRQEGARVALRAVLRARFGACPSDIDARLQALEDPRVLSSLVAVAATIPSLEAFAAELTRQGDD